MNTPATTSQATGRRSRFTRPVAAVLRRVGRRVLRLDSLAAPGNVLGDDLDLATLDLITRVVGQGEDVPGMSVYEKAQLHELAFWRWVAFMGYDGKPAAAFPRHQRDWMVGNFRKTGWSRWRLRSMSIVEIGCGPLGMIEYLPGRDKVAFDPLNQQYEKLFRKVRRNGVQYVSDLGSLVAGRAGTFDLGICFNVLDHTTEPRALFDAYMALIRPDGRFLFQVNLVKPGEPRPEAHARMHPSPFTRDHIESWLRAYCTRLATSVKDTPSVDNEYFFMGWGQKDRQPDRAR